MAGDLARRVARLELAEEVSALHRLRATKRPEGLPETPAATWSDGDLAQLWRSIQAAQEAGARRPLGWMGTADLLALSARLSGEAPAAEAAPAT
jgi:hypothetical protein